MDVGVRPAGFPKIKDRGWYERMEDGRFEDRPGVKRGSSIGDSDDQARRRRLNHHPDAPRGRFIRVLLHDTQRVRTHASHSPLATELSRFGHRVRASSSSAAPPSIVVARWLPIYRGRVSRATV